MIKPKLNPETKSLHSTKKRMQASERSDLSAPLQDFLTVCCPEIGANPKTLGVLPTTTIQQLSEQCAARFEQGNPASAVTAGTTQSSFLPVRISEHQHTSAQMKLFTHSRLALWVFLSVHCQLSPGVACLPHGGCSYVETGLHPRGNLCSHRVIDRGLLRGSCTRNLRVTATTCSWKSENIQSNL